jgi:hypothetical protein
MDAVSSNCLQQLTRLAVHTVLGAVCHAGAKSNWQLLSCINCHYLRVELRTQRSPLLRMRLVKVKELDCRLLASSSVLVNPRMPRPWPRTCIATVMPTGRGIDREHDFTTGASEGSRICQGELRCDSNRSAWSRPHDPALSDSKTDSFPLTGLPMRLVSRFRLEAIARHAFLSHCF